MIDLFKSDEHGYVPELNAEWFFTDPGIAYRAFKGVPMRQTSDGWQYQAPLEFTLGEDGVLWEWAPVYPFGGLWNMIRGKQIPSPFLLVDIFEKAESPYTNEYEIGDYVLQLGEVPKLIPERVEQISNLNDIDYTQFAGDAMSLYTTLKELCWPLRGNVDGVVFISDSGKAYLNPDRFDWRSYDDSGRS